MLRKETPITSKKPISLPVVAKSAASAKQQRTITSFFTTPNKWATSITANHSSGSNAPLSESIPASSEPDQNENHDDDADDDSRLLAAFASKKRGKFVIEDDNSDDGNQKQKDAAVVPRETETKRRRKETNPFSDDSTETEIDMDKNENSENKTPSRRSNTRLDRFASNRIFDGLRTPTTPSGRSPTPFAKSTPFASDKKKERADDFSKRNVERYAWLLDERDENKNGSGDEGYDPRTLYIPQTAWSKFSAFEKQFWEIKAKHWDTIVFFKKGKFFELYEKDAEVAHREFDWKLVDRVNMKMAGVPEMSFDSWASQFVARGYKVAKVDQVESAIAKDMNKKKQQQSSSWSSSTKQDNIIRRELTVILTQGTLVDTQLLTSDMSTYCLSIKEEVANDPQQQQPKFGVSFVDTATAEFNISWFTDDEARTHLETLLMQLKPKELVMEKGLLSAKTLKVIKNCLNESQYNYLVPGTEYWNAETTVDELRRTCYFGTVDQFADIS
ncbi:DNA mismatch repair protein msh6 [Physocladia obscura]|uniref:DNA mismatch repair protein msh6 n=1 Tax=Physocladia obscura TaxID=109957 RepID=A0AAD5T863_9FUNG|nr:DNA mismatch repair protein msh6 [Physocladia obscura]